MEESRLFKYVMKVLHKLNEPQGTSTARIVKEVRARLLCKKSSKVPRNVVMRVRHALHLGILRGVVMQRGGRYRLFPKKETKKCSSKVDNNATQIVDNQNIETDNNNKIEDNNTTEVNASEAVDNDNATRNDATTVDNNNTTKNDPTTVDNGNTSRTDNNYITVPDSDVIVIYNRVKNRKRHHRRRPNCKQKPKTNLSRKQKQKEKFRRTKEKLKNKLNPVKKRRQKTKFTNHYVPDENYEPERQSIYAPGPSTAPYGMALRSDTRDRFLYLQYTDDDNDILDSEETEESD